MAKREKRGKEGERDVEDIFEKPKLAVMFIRRYLIRTCVSSCIMHVNMF